jgi:nicotinate phosphoribosyltransferase
MDRDTVTLEGEPEQGTPLLVPVMRGGVRVAAPEPLTASRERAARALATLPPALRELDPSRPYQVDIAPPLIELARRFDASGGS